jgi:hypothetical protein
VQIGCGEEGGGGERVFWCRGLGVGEVEEETQSLNGRAEGLNGSGLTLEGLGVALKRPSPTVKC